MLLLRNGELIAGRITLGGDYYDVALSDGELRIKTTEVRLFCRDAHEVYETRRANLTAGKAEEHIELAEWCLRQHLADEAEVATGRRPHGRRDASQNRAASPPHSIVQSRADAARPATDAASLGLSDSGRTRTACARTTVGQHGDLHEHDPTAVAAPLFDGRLSRREFALDAQADADRTGRPTTRRATQRNLHATLAVIDRPIRTKAGWFWRRSNRTAPPRRRFSTPAMRPSTNSSSIGSTASAAKRKPNRQPPSANAVRHWRKKVAGTANREPAALPEPAATDEPANDPQPKDSDAETTDTAEPKRLDADPQAAPAQRPGFQPAPKIKRGATPTGFTPKDPFDAEIFNRRFFGK